MAHVEKPSIALTPEHGGDRAVESGDYASTSEVIRDAPRWWKTRRTVDEETVLELKHLWQESLDSGPAEPLDMDEVRHEARRRLGAGQKPGGRCPASPALPGPGARPSRPDIAPGLRLFPVRRSVILFRELPDGIEVARVVHGMRRLGDVVWRPERTGALSAVSP